VISKVVLVLYWFHLTGCVGFEGVGDSIILGYFNVGIGCCVKKHKYIVFVNTHNKAITHSDVNNKNFGYK
jgi:hypothetical protein